VKYDTAALPSLLDDFEGAVREFCEHARRDPAAWTRGRSGKWSVGQHADHIATMLDITATRFERATEWLRAGTLRPVPWRDPIQALAVGRLTREPFPRGFRAASIARPTAAPGMIAVQDRVAKGMRRHRALTRALAPEDIARLWIRNPFLPLRWHYTFPEIVRVHAVHARHHRRLVDEAIAAR
jgi:hypothetical protein